MSDRQNKRKREEELMDYGNQLWVKLREANEIMHDALQVLSAIEDITTEEEKEDIMIHPEIVTSNADVQRTPAPIIIDLTQLPDSPPLPPLFHQSGWENAGDEETKIDLADEFYLQQRFPTPPMSPTLQDVLRREEDDWRNLFEGSPTVIEYPDVDINVYADWNNRASPRFESRVDRVHSCSTTNETSASGSGRGGCNGGICSLEESLGSEDTYSIPTDPDEPNEYDSSDSFIDNSEQLEE